MKTLKTLLAEYGIRRMARDIDVQPSTVSRWAEANRVPRWWKPLVVAKLKTAEFRESK